MSVSLVSLGCPKNLVDSEVILARLAEGGCLVGAPMDRADVIVINTCGFLSQARQESMAVIREAIAHKRTGRCRRLIVAGCLCNRDGLELLQAMPEIDALVGVHDRDRILSAVLAAGSESLLTDCPAGAPKDRGRFRLTPSHTAYLRIAEGCSQRCTFCTIPAIRGPLRSKSPAVVLREARELADDGAAELNMIAQDTTSYGRDLARPMSLASLLRKLDRLEGVRWIRLLYTYPRRFTDDLIAAMGECRRVVPYVDIPLQHISDPVLRRMGRGVTRKAVEALLGKLRRRVIGLVVRTTFIVGFPGETDRQFRELLDFARGFRFDALGAFEYSPEEGTPAASMSGQVSDKLKARRAGALMAAQQEIAFAANRAMIGRPIEVLVDGRDAAGRCVGRYYGQAPDIDGVCYLSQPRPAGTFVAGTVSGWSDYDLLVRPD